WEFNHDMIGYNYRLPNINAALGCAQLEKLPELLSAKRALAERYSKAFAELPGVHFFLEPVNSQSNYWLNALLLDKECASQRDALLAATNNAGIMTRPVWTPLHKLSMFADCPKMDLPTAEDLEQRLINIPSSAMLASGLTNA
ncbi:MAG TPA: DegT/DnrJ/EryC1/StrS family aminotransferase, partial [Saprospiraceae bacterium]|nr:DegT/DnrJ/EryC1/StrS family aminotransferase [Saprospiraceae bacterium]